MKGKRIVYLLALIAFVFSSVPILSVAKSVKKRHNSVAVLVEPTAVPKVAPKTKSDRSKSTVQRDSHASGIIEPVLFRKTAPKN